MVYYKQQKIFVSLLTTSNQISEIKFYLKLGTMFYLIFAPIHSCVVTKTQPLPEFHNSELFEFKCVVINYVRHTQSDHISR